MGRRFWLIGLAGFWITMNILLWRSEFGAGQDLGSGVPVDLVWQKILTAPDDSTLELSYKGAKLGFCRWVTNAGDELATGKVGNENVELEGRVKKLEGYSADLDGSFLYPDANLRFRFELHSLFDTNRAWTEMSGRLILRPSTWEMQLNRVADSLHLRAEEAKATTWERRLRFSDLRDPAKLMPELGLAVTPEMLAAASGSTNLSLGWRWEAKHDSIKIGHSQVRAYRLQARLLDRFQVVIQVSRVGEILRVELPNGMVLLNGALNL